jgi:hypothetical protein
VLGKLLAPVSSWLPTTSQLRSGIPGLQDIPSLPAFGHAPPVAPAGYGGFYKWWGAQNGWLTENPKMDDLGVPPWIGNLHV